MIHGTQSPREVIRLFVARADRHSESETLRHGRHGRDDGQGFVHGPLRSGSYGGREIAGPGVDVVAAEDVGYEDPVEGAALEELGEGGPVGEGGEGGGGVGGVAPEAGGLVA